MSLARSLAGWVPCQFVLVVRVVLAVLWVGLRVHAQTKVGGAHPSPACQLSFVPLSCPVQRTQLRVARTSSPLMPFCGPTVMLSLSPSMVK